MSLHSLAPHHLDMISLLHGDKRVFQSDNLQLLKQVCRDGHAFAWRHDGSHLATAIFGMVPDWSQAGSFFVWFVLLREQSARALLRPLRQLLPSAFRLLRATRLRARVALASDTDMRFARFMGFHSLEGDVVMIEDQSFIMMERLP
jgi:hypothetical protein